MVSNSPGTQSIHCPRCGQTMRIAQSHPTWSGPCERCGQLLWFSPSAGVVAPIVEFDQIRTDQRIASLPASTYIPVKILQSVPKNVVRENRIFPIAEWRDAIVTAVSRRISLDTIEKLRFILNRHMLLVVIDDSALSQLIDCHYPEPHDRPS